MLKCLSTECLLQNSKCGREFVWICSYKLGALLSVKDEVKLWNTLHLVCNWCFSVVICLHSAECNILVLIWSGSTLKCWLKSHAWTATGRPKVNDNSSEIFNDLLQLDQTGYLNHFIVSRVGTCSSLTSSCSTHSWHSWHTASLRELLHHLLHLGVIGHGSHHICHVWVSSSHARHATHSWHSSSSSSWVWLWTCSILINLNLRLRAIILEQSVWINLQTVLHTHHHGSKLLAKGSLEKLSWQVDDVWRNTCAQQEHCALVGEVVAVVFKHVVLLHAKSVWHVS